MTDSKITTASAPPGGGGEKIHFQIKVLRLRCRATDHSVQGALRRPLHPPTPVGSACPVTDLLKLFVAAYAAVEESCERNTLQDSYAHSARHRRNCSSSFFTHCVKKAARACVRGGHEYMAVPALRLEVVTTQTISSLNVCGRTNIFTNQAFIIPNQAFAAKMPGDRA